MQYSTVIYFLIKSAKKVILQVILFRLYLFMYFMHTLGSELIKCYYYNSYKEIDSVPNTFKTMHTELPVSKLVNSFSAGHQAEIQRKERLLILLTVYIHSL